MENIIKKIEELKGTLTGDIFADGEVMDEILKLEIEAGITKPNTNGFAECVGCGA